MCGLLFSPDSGEILADNLEIKKIGLNNYRLGIACVPRKTVFSGSLIDNISGFDDNPDFDFVMECARRCNIHDEIMKMAMGYETIVGELGPGISGGQKQRILIARALYRKPSILFMDEATSHLDLRNESVINQSISALSITRIIVAHRPSTIASADRVIDLTIEVDGYRLIKEKNMQGTFIGFNTAGITFEERFLALLLKVKKRKMLLRDLLSSGTGASRPASDTAEQNGCDFPAA